MKVLFTNELINYDSLILKNNSFDLIVTIYWSNSEVDCSDIVKNEIKEMYSKNLNKLKNSWIEHILFFKEKRNIDLLISQIKNSIRKRVDENEHLIFYSYWIDNLEKETIDEENIISLNIEWWRFIWSKIIQNLYENRDTNLRRKKWKINIVNFSNKEKTVFEEINEKEDLESFEISKLSWIYSSWWLSEWQFIKCLTKSKEEYDFEIELLESFIQDLDVKRNSFNSYDFDKIFLNFVDDETKQMIEDYFDSCYVKQKYEDHYFNKYIDKVKETWYIHLWFIWNFVSHCIEKKYTLREAYDELKNFYDKFIVWWFNWINASMILLFFRFSDNRIFRFQEVSKVWIYKSFVDYNNN